MAGLEPDARTLVAIFRKHMPGGPKSADYLQPDPDILCARLEHLLMDICRIQRRKTGKFLQTCIKEAWALSHGEVKTFAQRLQAGLEHIYLNKKQAPSGKKLVARIIKLLSKEGLAEVPNASEQGKEDLQNLSPEQVSKLYEKFGVDTVPELAASSSSQLVPIEVCSSQEILASQASAAPPDVNYKQYTCSHAVALVRLFPDGSQTTATMKVGPGSFALGCFSSEEEHESEIPNSMVLAMDPKVKKAAKAAAKAAAMALKRPARDRAATIAAGPRSDHRGRTAQRPSRQDRAATVAAGPRSEPSRQDRAVSHRACSLRCLFALLRTLGSRWSRSIFRTIDSV